LRLHSLPPKIENISLSLFHEKMAVFSTHAFLYEDCDDSLGIMPIVEDKTAIVTAGAQGIGRGIAELLGEEGASVVLVDFNEEKGEETAEEFRDEGITAEFVYADVTDYDQCKAFVDATVEEYGAVDILVNVVGAGAGGSIEELEPDDWRRTVELNLTTTFNCTRAVAPEMISQGDGRIVNISSNAGRNLSYAGAASYTAAKWGVIGLTKHTAWDLGEHGITCNAVCPGPTKHEANDGKAEWEIPRKVPLSRWANPRDHAGAVLFLVSELGSYVTGSTVDTSGGILLGIRHEI
jgi:3-oxoacyl-[acyl-carrier protein] reductase